MRIGGCWAPAGSARARMARIPDRSATRRIGLMRCPPSATQAGQRVLGLGDEPAHHLTGGDDLADQPRRLTARGIAVVDVPLLARADARLAAHARALHGEGLDLPLALLPLAREVVADEATGLAGGRARHHRALLVQGHHLALVVVVAVRLGRRDE